MMAENHRTQQRLEGELQKNRRQLEMLRGEIAKVLSGESIYSEEDLAEALHRVKAKIAEDEGRLAQLVDEDAVKKQTADSIMPAYRQFRSWAEEFEDAPLEVKKMIACQLFSRIEIGKGYRIRVELAVTYRQFVEEWGGDKT